MNSKTQSPDGIILLNKPGGITSFQALGHIKKVLGTGKVGHTGTLDKFAEGLLILLTGKFTRFNSLVTGMDKTYEGLIHFGEETDTLDPEGKVIARAPVPGANRIRGEFKNFIGEMDQIPPLYSALHVDGQRAHKLARQGSDLTLPPRRICIHSLEYLDYQNGDLSLRVSCSKGTYIRALARDMGLACGSRAYLKALKRTAVGPFQSREAVEHSEFSGCKDFYPWEEFFKKIPDTGFALVNALGMEKMRHGVPFRTDFLKNPLSKRSPRLLFLKDEKGQLKAVLEKKASRYVYRINL